MTTDLIDRVLSITSGSHLDGLRRHREVARENIQKAYQALFEPADTTEVSLLERFAIAGFATGLHGPLALGDHYSKALANASGDTGIAAAVNAEIANSKTKGPYGNYPEGPLSSENKAGLLYTVSAANRDILGAKLSAALEHTHLLVYRPRDASKSALDALLAAGWTTAGIVTISQLVAFLSFQVRIVEGLSALAAQPATSHANDRLPQAASATA